MPSKWAAAREQLDTDVDALAEDLGSIDAVLREHDVVPPALTGLGAVVRYQYHRIIDAGPADREALAFIAVSPHRPRLLARLGETPARKADLSRGETDPSRTTVHRALEAFLDRRWVARDAATGQYATTADGRAVLEQYTALETVIEQALGRAAFLRCCPPEIEDISLDALAASPSMT